MNQKEKIAFIRATLDTLFPNPSIPLSHKDSYTLLIAVLLSARCQDARVNQITPALFTLADTPQKMVDLGYDKVLSIIRPLGLSPGKSKNIIALSKILLEKWAGQVPETLEALETLPGVGHKTASVVLVQAFNRAAFPVDTHIIRLAQRWGLSKSKNPVQVERDLKKIFPKKLWGKVHLQIIYFGRQFCPARGHKIAHCPICSCLI